MQAENSGAAKGEQLDLALCSDSFICAISVKSEVQSHPSPFRSCSDVSLTASACDIDVQQNVLRLEAAIHKSPTGCMHVVARE